MFTTSIGMLLTAELGARVVGEARDGRTAVRLAEELTPHVVVMDIEMPELNGIEATRQVRNLAHPPKVIALSGHLDRRSAVEILKAGANALVPKTSAVNELAEAIRAVMENKIFISPSVTASVLQGWTDGDGSNDPESASVFQRVSPREREVLQLIAEGFTTKQIAARLFISGKTVETHRRHMMERLGFTTVAELVKYAIREGITSVNENKLSKSTIGTRT